MSEKLRLLPRGEYRGVNEHDPIRYYYYPVFGPLYRRRVELCLNECRGGANVLEVGFGTGLAFLNLADKYQTIHGLDLTADTAAVGQVFERLGIRTELRNGSVLEMPYENDTFDTVLLISILEHLQPAEQPRAFSEIRRVLKPGGQVVYGVPVERPLMVSMFKLLGYDIRQAHFSTERDVAAAARAQFREQRIVRLNGPLPGVGAIYEVGHFVRA